MSGCDANDSVSIQSAQFLYRMASTFNLVESPLASLVEDRVLIYGTFHEGAG